MSSTGFRFRMYPTGDQEAAMLAQCAHARFVWNLALEQQLMWRRWQGRTPNLAQQMLQLSEARAAEAWLAEGSVTVQQQALRDHDHAWAAFYRGTKGKPKWRKRGQREGFRIVGRQASRVRRDSGEWAAVNVPKVGWVKFRLSGKMPKWKSYRVTKDPAGRWHIAFAAIPDPIPAPETGEVVGVDRGVAVAVTLSTGEMTSPPGLRPKEAERQRRLQRRYMRSAKGSARRERTRRQCARLHARAKDRRKDWVEKTSTDLARRFDVIHLERLEVQKMTKSARGTVNKPGRWVRQKAGLNRSIHAQCWSLLAIRLEQKAPGRVEKVPARFTSQRCNACGHVAPENRKSQAVFRCVACGHRANADVNAACNIRDREPTAVGRTVAARGDLVHERPVSEARTSTKSGHWPPSSETRRESRWGTSSTGCSVENHKFGDESRCAR